MLWGPCKKKSDLGITSTTYLNHKKRCSGSHRGIFQVKDRKSCYPYLVYAVKFWSLHYLQDVELGERGQRLAKALSQVTQETKFILRWGKKDLI